MNIRHRRGVSLPRHKPRIFPIAAHGDAVGGQNVGQSREVRRARREMFSELRISAIVRWRGGGIFE